MPATVCLTIPVPLQQDATKTSGLIFPNIGALFAESESHPIHVCDIKFDLWEAMLDQFVMLVFATSSVCKLSDKFGERLNPCRINMRRSWVKRTVQPPVLCAGVIPQLSSSPSLLTSLEDNGAVKLA